MKTHRVSVCAVGALAGFALVAGSAQARPIVPWQVNATGAEEVPVRPSLGTAALTGTINDATGLVTITSGTYQDMTTNTNGSHLHGPAPVGVNAGIVLALTHSSATSGVITGSGVLTRAGFTTQQLIDAFFSGNVYYNLHTTQFPGGEIRGQVVLVPTSGAAGLAAVAGLALLRRRR